MLSFSAKLYTGPGKFLSYLVEVWVRLRLIKQITPIGDVPTKTWKEGIVLPLKKITIKVIKVQIF